MEKDAFAGVRLRDFVAWLKRNYQFIDQYCANLKPDEYRKEETFNFTKVYKHEPDKQEYAWFIQHFTLLGSDGVIPADKKAIPRQYWFVNGKYYESTSAFAPTGILNQFSLNQTPDLKNRSLHHRKNQGRFHQRKKPLANHGESLFIGQNHV